MDSSGKRQNPTRLVGDYILGPCIGSGSFAVVWRSRHRKSGVVVAMKEINKKLLSSKLSQNLHKEISILSSINHPNIIRLLDAIETKEKIYIVLEYCEGGDLAAYINRNGKVSQSVARHFMKQLAAGLQVLQEKRLIHRDLKPQNLLLASHDLLPVLKLGDFGFARSLTHEELADTLCGSPLYMAPEIIQNQKYDAKADLWSVGTILFQLVTGKPPYEGNNQLQLFKNIFASTEPRFPEGALEELHPDCVDLCKSLLRQNPVQRITFMEFFDHKFLKEPRLEVNAEQSSQPPQVKSTVEHFDFYKSRDFHSGNPQNSSSGNIGAGSSASGSSSSNKNIGCVADSLESIVKEYALVTANFASMENFSYYLDTSLHDASGTTHSICTPTSTSVCRTDPVLDISRSSMMLREVRGQPILHATRLQFFHLYLHALAELAQEKNNAGSFRESFSVELVILATWKQALQICNSWMASTREIDTDISNPEENVDFSRPPSVSSWAEHGFIEAYDRAESSGGTRAPPDPTLDTPLAESISHHIQDLNANAEMPDAMEIIYQKALSLGKTGAVDEYMENKGDAAAAYSRAMLLLSFIMGEATALTLNPPFSLTPADKQRIQNYISKLQSRQSQFLISQHSPKK